VRQHRSSGGVFDVRLDDELLFSKHQVRRHAEQGEVIALIRQRTGAS
jgi:hypothetical protein